MVSITQSPSLDRMNMPTHGLLWQGEAGRLTSRGGSPCTGLLKENSDLRDGQTSSTISLFSGIPWKKKIEQNLFEDKTLKWRLKHRWIEDNLDQGSRIVSSRDREERGFSSPGYVSARFTCHNNNCSKGYLKGGMEFIWNKIEKRFSRKVFPIAGTAALQAARWAIASAFFLVSEGTRVRSGITLDELAPDRGNHDTEPKIECSRMQCYARRVDALAGSGTGREVVSALDVSDDELRSLPPELIAQLSPSVRNRLKTIKIKEPRKRVALNKYSKTDLLRMLSEHQG